VAYVRTVRTASGAATVQVVRKNRGPVVILGHVGSAHTDPELAFCSTKPAKSSPVEQEALDIEVSTRPERIERVPNASRMCRSGAPRR
jgi:hypothetical protein